MLSDRRQRVLAALIEEYVLHAAPVGSRTLVERHQLGVSSATVRNELSVLEDAGYIAQPHTSAGRIPTDVGYRSFVDDLLASESIDQMDEKTSEAARTMQEAASEIDDLIEQASSALARLTACLSIVVPPSVFSLQVKQVSFVALAPTKLLIVAVTEDGQVLNRHVDVTQPVIHEDVRSAEAIANSLVSGRKVSELGDVAESSRASIAENPILGVLIDELLLCLKQAEGSHAQAGLTTLMQQPEFSYSQSIIPVMNMLEDDTVLMQIVSGTRDDVQPMVRIGHENESEDLHGVSVVASRYGRGDAEGIVAVIGPTRMDYASVIRAVRMARGALQDI